MTKKNSLSLKHLVRAVELVYRSSPKWTFINSILTILRGLIPLLLLLVVKQLIDVVDPSNGIDSINNTEILKSLSLVGSFFLLNAISGSVNSLTRERQSHFLKDYIQKLIHSKTVHLPYGYFEDSSYQDLFFRAINEANFRPGKVFYSILGLFQNTITLLVMLSVLTTFNWLLIPVLLGIGIPIIFFRMYYSRKEYELKLEQTEDERRLQYFNRLLVGKDFAKEVRIFNLSKTFSNKYNQVRDEVRNKQWSISKSKTLRESIVQILSTIILLVVFSFIISEAIKGNITNGAMAMYFLALQRSYAVLQELLTRMSSLLEDNLFLKNFFDFQNIEIPAQKNAKGNFPLPLQNGIVFKNVSFKYPNTDRYVFHDLNLSIPAGHTVALVGANGSGKTTIVKLLAGLYKPTNGEILFDKNNLSKIHPSDLAENISIIFQDFMLYNVSAKDNIRFGNMRRPFSMEQITDAAKNAGIHNIFDNLKDGYDTHLGTLFKDSEMLSRGEWQRTALARSFYNDAQVIILDEPTSSLDAYTEANLINHFKEITKKRTAIIVSHRLSTIHLADTIIVLKDGEICENGSYEDLISLKGEFYNMINVYQNPLS
ncbi:ABC transporter ATP-binding protein [Carboxylicivirga linearis]|uniref:ABC transporter ATP-binding protein n=1 Tax=Carboxylicivirga linearis TaxID=1628157 RepID=A0ABS5JZA3_9BACT|nr:ABC transporter ATP-binding protein [Carboxylicivirga linearis]MBS2100244.1 ABC transporter ATP-binding protein [Carboxylicivirga linearis]